MLHFFLCEYCEKKSLWWISHKDTDINWLKMNRHRQAVLQSSRSRGTIFCKDWTYRSTIEFGFSPWLFEQAGNAKVIQPHLLAPLSTIRKCCVPAVSQSHPVQPVKSKAIAVKMGAEIVRGQGLYKIPWLKKYNRTFEINRKLAKHLQNPLYTK